MIIFMSIMTSTISIAIALLVAFLNWKIIKRHDFTLELYSKVLAFLREIQGNILIFEFFKKENIKKTIYQQKLEELDEKISLYITILKPDIIKSKYILKDEQNIRRIFKCILKFYGRYKMLLLKIKNEKHINDPLIKLILLSRHYQKIIDLSNHIFDAILNHPYKSYFSEKPSNSQKIFLKPKAPDIK